MTEAKRPAVLKEWDVYGIPHRRVQLRTDAVRVEYKDRQGNWRPCEWPSGHSGFVLPRSS